MGKGQGHEKEGRGGVDEEVLLEACVVGHHHLSMKPLVKTEEDISGKAVIQSPLAWIRRGSAPRL